MNAKKEHNITEQSNSSDFDTDIYVMRQDIRALRDTMKIMYDNDMFPDSQEINKTVHVPLEQEKREKDTNEVHTYKAVGIALLAGGIVGGLGLFLGPIPAAIGFSVGSGAGILTYFY